MTMFYASNIIENIQIDFLYIFLIALFFLLLGLSTYIGGRIFLLGQGSRIKGGIIVIGVAFILIEIGFILRTLSGRGIIPLLEVLIYWFGLCLLCIGVVILIEAIMSKRNSETSSARARP